MKAIPISIAAGLLLCACASPNRPQGAPGAQALGVPDPVVDSSVTNGTPGQNSAVTDPGAIQMPQEMTLPASYRLMLVDGHLALVRETDTQALAGGPTSLRVVTGEIARGDLAYQPGLLPQELAAEVASNRESAARMDNALESVMQRSRELSDQAAELKAQAERLGALLAGSQAATAAAGPAAKHGAPSSAQDSREGQSPISPSPEQPTSPQN